MSVCECVFGVCSAATKKIINEKQHKSRKKEARKIFVKTKQQISPVKNVLKVHKCLGVRECTCVCVTSVLSPCKAGNYHSK